MKMKKSERLREIEAALCCISTVPARAATAKLLLQGEEALGVVWDPEEEPLPERLHSGPLSNGGVWIGSLSGPELLKGEKGTESLAAEAVRRYNAWWGLLKTARSCRDATERIMEIIVILTGGKSHG
jgi:hypothetical protein